MELLKISDIYYENSINVTKSSVEHIIDQQESLNINPTDINRMKNNIKI